MNEYNGAYRLIHTHTMPDLGGLFKLFIKGNLYDLEPVPETANEISYHWEFESNDGLFVGFFSDKCLLDTFKRQGEIIKDGCRFDEKENKRVTDLFMKIDAYAKDVLENETLPDIKDKTLEKYVNQTQQNGQPQIFYQNGK
ncbi:hypothetical protein KPA96_13780 [Burkholderia cenocepacia]|uniref:hypothetical protein n=1 Tax=Burkholderia cenocepacia TaxID=95486 RepID=UPI00285AEADA|nr:hypothetical protein [Burkholderia cenocepacia]MDR8076727.1 hypothetical protein [Burkholderia cenocepacia]